MASSRNLPASPPPAPDPRPSLVVQTLLTMARQRDGLSESTCQTVLTLIETSAILRAHIQRQVAREGLTRAQLDLLLALVAIEPVQVSPTDLALHMDVSRAAVSSVLASLVRQRLVVRVPGSTDRRHVCIRLTAAGRTAADRAAMRCLRLLGAAALRLSPTLQHALRLGCALLHEGTVHTQPA